MSLHMEIQRKVYKGFAKYKALGFPRGGSVLKISLSNAGMQFLYLVGKLRSHVPHGQFAKIQTRSKIVTNAIKILKKEAAVPNHGRQMISLAHRT